MWLRLSGLTIEGRKESHSCYAIGLPFNKRGKDKEPSNERYIMEVFRSARMSPQILVKDRHSGSRESARLGVQ